LARQVGCSAITLRKLEAEERHPSKQIAQRLADVLQVAPDDRSAFLRFARGDPFAGPADDKAPKKPEPPKHNLPLQLTSFIGRETEIGQIRRQLARARLLTLTGAGGSGKTRLALEAAGGLLPQFPDGTWLVELASLAEPALLPQTVANTLGLREVPGVSITAVLLDHLRPRQILLLLDNCEHLIQACAELVEKMLSACPSLKVLATSREALSIAGESAYLVPALSLPGAAQTRPDEILAQSEAVRVFVERAAEALPGFELTDDNALVVAQVCRQLDGIPLAIELAAARVKVLDVEQIADRLSDRFSLLRGGSRTALPRHRTLQGLMDWSYDLLSEPERVLLQRLAVFAGGWTLEAAEAVGAGQLLADGDVLERLTQLASKSLVVVDRPSGAAPRYHLLETIRQYALARLVVSGEADAVRQRHAAYYLALCEAGMPAPDQKAQPAWLDQIETEHDNVRAALTWAQSAAGGAELGLRLAVAMHGFWAGHGFWSEARAWLATALAQADVEAPQDRQSWAWALARASSFAGLQGDYTAAQKYLARSLTLFQELGDRQESARALELLGWVAREQGDIATARLRLEESLALNRELGHKSRIPWVLNTLGEVAVVQEDVAWAIPLLEEGLALFRAQEVREGIAWSLNHLGHVAQLQGQFARARQLHEDSLPFFRVSAADNLGNLGVACAFQGLGETALAQGSATSAATHLCNALVMFRDLGDRAGMSWCLSGLAGAAALDEEPERAARLWGAAEALRLSIGTRNAPAARATRERLMAAAREQLGEAAFDAAWAEGQAIKPEQAIEMALEAV
jgi:predicted ATPase